MKPRITNPFRSGISAIITVLTLGCFAAPSASAITLFWSGNGTTQGGPGTWDTTLTRWGTVAAGPYTSVWNNANNDVAEFNNGTGTITLGANVTVGGINAKTGSTGNTIAEGAGPYTITLGVTGSNTVSTVGNATLGRTLKVDAVVAGASGANLVLAGPTTSGAGTISLNRANTFAGGTSFTGHTSGANTLILGHQNALQNSTLTLSSACLALTFDKTVLTNTFTLGGLAASTPGAGRDFALQNNDTIPAAIALSVGNNNANTTYAGVLSGAGSLTKIGSGFLQLNGSNTYAGGTDIQQGSLYLGAGASGGKLNTSSAITISSGANFGIYQADTVVQGTDFSSGAITGAGNFIQVGSGTTIFNAANNYTGTTTIYSGMLKHEAPATLTTGNLTFDGITTSGIYTGVLALTSDFTRALGTGDNQVQWTASGGFAAFGADCTVSLNGGGNVQWGAGSFLPSSRGLILGHVDATHKVIFANNINFATGSTRPIQVDNGAATVDGVISGTLGISGGVTGGFTKTGDGTLELTNANLYTGATNVSAGTLRLSNLSALGATSGITIAGGASLTPTLDGITISAPVALGVVSTTSTINAPTSGGSLAVNTLTLNGKISGAGNLKFNGNNGANSFGTILLGAANDYTGTTEITCTTTGANCFVKNGLADALPVTTVLTMNGGAGAGSGRTVQYDLNGYNQTLAGLNNTPALALRNQRITNLGAAATLTINNSADCTFGGVVDTGGTITRARIEGAISLVKSGVGTFTLVEPHTYTGDTTVNAGLLSIDGNNPSNNASTVTIAASGATLKLDYVGTDTVNKLFIGATQMAAGEYKAVGSAATGTELAQLTGTGTLTVTSGPSSGYAAWQSANGTLGGRDQDHDGDGVDNGTEHFIYGPVANSSFTPLPGVDNNAGVLSVTWTHAAGYTGTYGPGGYEVEVSSTLGSWGPPLGGTVTFPSATQVKYTFPAGTKNFARLKVTGP